MVTFDHAKTASKKVDSKRSAFLCIITPVFDPAYKSLHKLVGELKSQTYGNFFQVMISNGPSPRINKFVFELNKKDSRFIYDEIGEEITNSPKELLINLGKRREYCLTKYDAERYVFLDADVKIVDKDYFLKLYKAHKEIKRDVLITLVKMGGELTLPIFPIRLGRIDMANFSFSKRIAKRFSYPTDFDQDMGIGNDYRFFSKIAHDGNTAILNFISAMKDGNSSYKRLSDFFLEEQQKNEKRQKNNFRLWKFLRPI